MSQEQKISRRKLLGLVGLGAAATVGVGAIGNQIQLEEVELKLKNWDADGFRLAFLSDFHLNDDRLLGETVAGIRLAISKKPHTILLGGDFLNVCNPSTLANIGKAMNEFRNYSGPVFSVLGNHDYKCGNPGAVVEALRQTPVRLLQNELVEVDGVTIAGLDDGLFYRQQPGILTDPRTSKSLISLFHEPDFVDQMPMHVSLQLSGHSHGGEVCMPWGSPIYTPYGSKKYVRGYYPEAHVPLYVTRGVCTLAPFRLYCPPEVTLLTLRG